MKAEKERPKSWKVFSASKKGSVAFPFLAFEWSSEWISYHLGKWAFLEVLEYIGKLSLLVALIFWFVPGCRERRQAVESAKQAAADARTSRHYVAWQTLNSAVGKPGNAGRVDALQDLNRDKIQLDGISLVGGGVLVGPLDLTNASLTHSDFSDCVLQGITFDRANLYASNWKNVRAENCSFRGSFLWSWGLNNTEFMLCDFGLANEKHETNGTDFGMQSPGSFGSKFTLCNLAGADFGLSIWDSVSFSWCNFAYANLSGVHPENNASMLCCNLYKASASPEFIKWASKQQVVFTNVLSLDQWHICLTNRSLNISVGGAEFQMWASNQFVAYNKTNDPTAWLIWSRENIEN